MKYTSEEVMQILRQIQDIKTDKDGELKVKFNEPSNTADKDGYEFTSGYIYNSFSYELFIMIEDALNGNLTKE